MSNRATASSTEDDLFFMKRALALAERGRGHVSPNPLVGAVVVKGDEIVGEGYHQKFGEAHAEVNALENAGDAATGATLYVTLEPCAHQGKTGPCTEKIYSAGISRAVIGVRDPNPLVNGKGITFLKSKGISVTESLLESDCRELNAGYLKYITTKRPLITLKIAQTIDGRIATSTGHSKWITSPDSRIMAHRIRAQNDALLVGIGTVIADDPELTVRLTRGVSPKRIILDSQLRIPLDAHALADQSPSRTIVMTTEEASKEKIARIEEKGATVIVTEADERGWVSQKILWPKLAEMGITSVLVEGGSTIHTECIKAGYADRIVLFLAPKLLGSGIDALGDLGIRNVNAAREIRNIKIKRLNGDLMISGTLGQSD